MMAAFGNQRRVLVVCSVQLATTLGSGGCTLTRLDLWDDSITDVGVGALAAALPRSRLRLLGLWGTPFTDGVDGEGLADSTGLAALGAALRLSPALCELNLFGNAAITVDGIQGEPSRPLVRLCCSEHGCLWTAVMLSTAACGRLSLAALLRA